MEHIIKQLKKGAKHTRLSSAEKAEMRSMLLRHVKTNPVRVEGTLRALATSNGAGPVRTEMFERQQFVKGNRSILSPFQINNLRNNFGRASKDIARHDFAKSTMPILVILGLLMGGSASFAAENTVPGEVLYPVKVHVNETVRGTFAVTPKAKAEWEVRLVERRLEEVEELATDTDVSEEVRQIASANLGVYTERVHGRIAKFEEDEDSDDAILTAGELADLFRAHEEVLVGLNTQVAGAVATSTGAVMATTTAATATSTALAETSLVAGSQSLESFIAQLRKGRGHAEEKHKELKRKYHRDDDDEDKDDEEDGDDVDMSRAWAPIPATGTAAGTTTNATVGTSTSAIQMVAPTILPVSRKSSDRKESKKREERHEEIRALAGNASTTLATGVATTSVDIAPAEHAESRTEGSTDSDSSDSRDDNDND